MHKITPFRLLIPVILLLSLTHCAPQDQVSMLQRQVNGLAVENRGLANRVKELQAQVVALRKETQKAGKKDITSIRQTQADLANRLEELQSEILRINGLLEQQSYQQQKDKDAEKRFREEIMAELSKLRGEVQLLQSSTRVTKEVEQARKKVAQGEVDLYQQALDLIKQNKFNEAKKVLKAFIQKRPHSKRVANAYFWIGECEYRLQRYEEAILEYQKVISQFPKSNKVPDALLKQGLAFARLGDIESAKIVLNKLVRKFPKSPQARVARRQLKRFK